MKEKVAIISSIASLAIVASMLFVYPSLNQKAVNEEQLYNNIQTILDEKDSSINKLESKIDEINKSFSDKQEKNNEKLSELMKKVDQTDDKYQSLQKSVDNISTTSDSAKIEELSNKISELIGKVDESNAKYSELAEEFASYKQTTQKNFDKTQKEIEKLESKVQEQSNTLQEVSKEIKSIKQSDAAADKEIQDRLTDLENLIKDAKEENTDPKPTTEPTTDPEPVNPDPVDPVDDPEPVEDPKEEPSQETDQNIISFSEIKMFTLDEYNQNSSNIPLTTSGLGYWLNTSSGNFVYVVQGSGVPALIPYYKNPSNPSLGPNKAGVRPVLVLEKNPGLKVGDKFKLGSFWGNGSWTMISENYAISDDIVSSVEFSDCQKVLSNMELSKSVILNKDYDINDLK